MVVQPRQVKDLLGMRFSRLEVIAFHGLDRRRQAFWLCQCDCGNKTVVAASELKKGATKSCKCFRRDYATERGRITKTKHGLSRTNEYKIWECMKRRCQITERHESMLYAKRGIRVCNRWLYGDGTKSGFECFYEDMGLRPSKQHSLERLDNNGNYEPSNVVWALHIQQANNRRQNYMVVYREQRMTMTEAWRLSGKKVQRTAIKYRLEHGWNTDDAFDVPAVVHPRDRTHCRHGHEYTEENTYITYRGERICRVCKLDYDARANAKKKAKALAFAVNNNG